MRASYTGSLRAVAQVFFLLEAPAHAELGVHVLELLGERVTVHQARLGLCVARSVSVFVLLYQ